MSHTMYADDLILFAKGIAVAQRMLDDVRVAFATAGLRVNAEKCHYLFKEGSIGRFQVSEVHEQLELDGAVIERHEQLICLGSCIKVKKDSLGAFLPPAGSRQLLFSQVVAGPALQMTASEDTCAFVICGSVLGCNLA